MYKKLLRNLQTAQGMVEFALVLPILLLVILGIFAFGHMFFVYSSVVSASREAARWGSAVGEAPSTFPRYQDCDSIRAAAVRLGSFAGVNASNIDTADDTGIEVSYDNGPDTTIYDSCPAGGEGPSDVVMGDRIVVRVKVNYVPIVPFVELPSFPLEAVTFRTILRSVPVGEAPTAVDPCTSSTTIDLFADPEPSMVGQEVIYSVRVNAVEDRVDYPPVGTVELHDDLTDDMYTCSGTLQDETEHTSTYVCGTPATYWHAGVRTVSVRYESGDSCFLSSNTTDPGPDPTHEVVQAGTTMTLGASPATWVLGSSTPIHVTVTVASTGGTPQGYVNINFPGQAPLLNVPLVNGMASGDFTPTSAATYTITVDYPEDASPDYAAVSKTINVTVLEPTAIPTGTPTFINTPTNTPIPVIPTKTPLPSYCPRLASSGDIFSVGSAIQFDILNPNVSGSSKTDLTSIDLTWPSDPAANLQEIRFGSAVDSCSSQVCLLQNAAGLAPTHQTISSSTSGWSSNPVGMKKGETKTMRMVFNHSMPMGSYSIVIRFSANNCVLEIDREKITP